MTLAEIETVLNRTIPGTPEFERAYALWVRVMDNAHGPGQMARIAARIGIYNPNKLDTSVPVYDDLDAWEQTLTEGETA